MPRFVSGFRLVFASRATRRRAGLTYFPGCLALSLALTSTAARADEKSARQEAVQALMETARRMEDVPFRDVVLAATGHRVLAVNPDSAPDAALLDHLAKAADGLVAWLNGPAGPGKDLRRINEASRPVEDELRRLLHAGEFTCTIPPTTEGKVQRSGYPDLRIVHVPTGRVTYLDPKLFENGSKASTFRSFYYEPNELTGKVQHDARHILLGISHNGQDGAWKFQNWELVDLHDFRVKLKVEFQGSNKEVYRPELLLRKSAPAPVRPPPPSRARKQ